MKRVELFGVTVDPLTLPEAVVELRERLDRGQRTRVVTLNPEIMSQAQHNASYREILNAAELRLADGVGLLWATDYLAKPLRGPMRTPRAYLRAFTMLLRLALNPSGKRLPEAVPGAELADSVAAMCEEFGYRLFLLGAAERVAERAAETLLARYPELQLAGAMSGSPKQTDDEDVRGRIEQAQAHVILVAYGAPKQEMWMARNVPRLPAPLVAIGVGGTFDYWAGAVSVYGGGRAKPPPHLVRTRGFEWLWRLVTQPSRWRRVAAALPLFVHRVVQAQLKDGQA